MSRLTPTRETKAILSIACLGACLGSGAFAATAQVPVATGQGRVTSTLPTQQPTRSVAASAVPNVPTPVRSTKLEVALVDGKLTVSAENASLNQVLREVSNKTGVRISGSVGEESVFGNYGPASTAEILTALLEGTGSNMLLVDNQTGPQELILTPRRGRASAPSQNAGLAQNNTSDSQDQDQQYVPPIQPFRPPVATGRGPVGANADGSPAFNQPVDDNSGATVNGGGPQRTPQQIYEQLQSLSNQQQQANPPE